MHSRRMRTIRSSNRLSRGWGGVGGCLPQCMLGYQPPLEQAPLPREQTPRDQAAPRSRHSPRGQTHACENITFETSLRTVKIIVNISELLNVFWSYGLTDEYFIQCHIHYMYNSQYNLHCKDIHLSGQSLSTTILLCTFATNLGLNVFIII